MIKAEKIQHFVKNGEVKNLVCVEYYEFFKNKGWVQVKENHAENWNDGDFEIINIEHENGFHKRKNGSIGRRKIMLVWDNPNPPTGGV